MTDEANKTTAVTAPPAPWEPQAMEMIPWLLIGGARHGTVVTQPRAARAIYLPTREDDLSSPVPPPVERYSARTFLYGGLPYRVGEHEPTPAERADTERLLFDPVVGMSAFDVLPTGRKA